jgi:geranylgeranyl diphosphate synthase type II
VPALDAYLAARRAEIDAALEAYLPTAADSSTTLAEAMRYSVMAGGKRLRPILTLASAEAIALRQGTPDDAARRLAMAAACAIEMIHTYSLIHDDLPAMDDDVLRRGRPTLHVVYGDGMAILAGDGLQARAFALVAEHPKSTDAGIAERKLMALQVIAHAAGPVGMVGGQAIDLEAVRPTPGRGAPLALDAGTLADMHARKTGAMIRAAAVAGGIMAGGERADLAALDAYARDIGLAFQIVDDVLDVEGDAGALGKTAGKDAMAGKPTYPAMFGIARSKQMAEEYLTRACDALRDGGLGRSWLGEIAEWIVRRRS